MPYNQSVQSRLPVCLDHTAHFYDICPLPSLVVSLTSVLDDRARPGYAGQDDGREGTHGTLRGRSSPREKAATGQKWTLSDTFQRLIPIGPFISTGIPRPDANLQSGKWQEMTENDWKTKIW